MDAMIPAAVVHRRPGGGSTRGPNPPRSDGKAVAPSRTATERSVPPVPGQEASRRRPPCSSDQAGRSSPPGSGRAAAPNRPAESRAGPCAAGPSAPRPPGLSAGHRSPAAQVQAAYNDRADGDRAECRATLQTDRTAGTRGSRREEGERRGAEFYSSILSTSIIPRHCRSLQVGGDASTQVEGGAGQRPFTICSSRWRSPAPGTSWLPGPSLTGDTQATSAVFARLMNLPGDRPC